MPPAIEFKKSATYEAELTTVSSKDVGVKLGNSQTSGLPMTGSPSTSKSASTFLEDMAVKTSLGELAKSYLLTPQFAVTLGVFVICEIIIVAKDLDPLYHFLSCYFFFLCAFSPIATSPTTFFNGEISTSSKTNKSFMVLASSTMISWIFAKSVQNASVLGAKFGIAGGFGYASWYVSFVSTASVVYKLRMKGYMGLPHAIFERYGSLSMLVFCAALIYRLYNEVWSNAMVVSSFFSDEPHSADWWWSAIISTLVPLIYVLMGGLKSSLYSDVLQAVMFIGGLIIVLINVSVKHSENDVLVDFLKANHTSDSFFTYNPVATDPSPDGTQFEARNPLTLEGGMDLLLTGALQGLLSYPFFDPVLTDRAFLAHPRTMARSLAFGGLVAGIFIVLFSIIGVYGSMLGKCVEADVCGVADLGGTWVQTFAGNSTHPVDGYYAGAGTLAGVKGGTPAEVAKTMGDGMFNLLFVVMSTSSISTLDSTFTSTAKLCGPDIAGFFSSGKPVPLSQATEKHMLIGRIAMVALAFIGTLPLLMDVSELNATTVSGTVVMGLGGPVVLMAYTEGWKKGQKRPLAFLVPFLSCAAIGICYTLTGVKNRDGELEYDWMNINFSQLTMGDGSYGKLLGVNVTGAVMSLGLYFVFANNDWCFGHDFDEEEEDGKYELVRLKEEEVEKVV